MSDYFMVGFVSRDMRRNPINLILTGIAVADLLMMLEYIPFAAHMYLLKYQGSRWLSLS